jgi:hypothetical protein
MNNSTASSDVTITILSDANQIVADGSAFSVGTLLQYKRSGTGNVIIAEGIVEPEVPSYQTYNLDDVITYRKIAANTWECLNPPKDLSILNSDVSYNSNGLKLTGQTVGGSNGNAVYLSGSNTWSITDASAEATSKSMIGIRISATEVLTHGVYTTSGLTAGSTYYLSETGGAITTTAPSTSASIVRVIGYALSTTELFINTDQAYFENA